MSDCCDIGVASKIRIEPNIDIVTGPMSKVETFSLTKFSQISEQKGLG